MRIYADHDDGSVIFARVPNELKLMFAEELGIHDVSALARTCREMNELLTRMIYRRAKDSKGKWGRPYFLLAVDGGNLAAVGRFVGVGAEVNMTDTDVDGDLPETAVHSCAHYGHVEMAEFLIDKEINVSDVDSCGYEPLHRLVKGEHPKEAMVTLLVKAGADVNALYYWETPLHMAAMNANVGVVQCLLNLGADLDAADWDGTRPVHLAAAYSNAATVRCLLEAGGKNVEIADNDGFTPLHYAARFGKTEAVEVLLEMGANVSSVDGHGWTPLHSAVYSHGNEATVHRILHLDASRTYECVSRCQSDQSNHSKIEMLLAAGADIAKPNNYGHSLLSWAADRHTTYYRSPKYPTYE